MRHQDSQFGSRRDENYALAGGDAIRRIHELLRDVGLLRMRKGVLTPIRAAGDDLTVLRRIRAAFDPRSFHTALTELTIAMLAVHGPATLDQLAAQVYPHLGHNWQLTGRRLSEPDVRYAIVEQSSFMAGLDLLDNSNRHAWTLGPSARTLLPGVSILIDYFAATA